jgi:16S rRNA (adenine1518-N6/adenine1519-N6)-dimethyltransferase
MTAAFEPLKLADLRIRMQAYGVRPSKKLGQNFLADFNLLKAIVADAEVGPGDFVLEVGTGAGSLTGYLAEAAGMVLSVELDRGMFELSRDILQGTPNLVQLRADALANTVRGLSPVLLALLRGYVTTGKLDADTGDAELVVHGDKYPRGLTLKLVANLPYSVAGAVILGALESLLPFERMLVMVQHEVGEKMSARPGDREWGLPSLLLSRFATARMLRKVPGKVFWPRPRVDSALLDVRPHHQLTDLDAYHRLRRLAHLLFQHRRKAAANSLANVLGMPASQCAQWLRECGALDGQRAEEITPEALQRLADHREVEPLVRMALDQHEDQIAAKAAKKARRAEWKQRVYGDEE